MSNKQKTSIERKQQRSGIRPNGKIYNSKGMSNSRKTKTRGEDEDVENQIESFKRSNSRKRSQKRAVEPSFAN